MMEIILLTLTYSRTNIVNDYVMLFSSQRTLWRNSTCYLDSKMASILLAVVPSQVLLRGGRNLLHNGKPSASDTSLAWGISCTTACI